MAKTKTRTATKTRRSSNGRAKANAKGTSTRTKSLPPRSKVKAADQWNLASLFQTDEEWERAFKRWEGMTPTEYRSGHLPQPRPPKAR